MAKSYLEPEYAELYERWRRDPSPANAGALLRAVRPIIEAALTSYAGGDRTPAMRARAKALVLEALRQYDPRRAKLRTFLLVHLQRLRRLAARRRNPLTVPERSALLRQQLEEAERELEADLGRPPTTEELADRLGVNPRKLEEARQAPLAQPLSRIETMAGEAAEEESGPLGVAFRPLVGMPDFEQKRFDAVRRLFHQDLQDPVDKLLFEHRAGMHPKPKSPSRLARELGLTPSAISQRLKRLDQQFADFAEVVQL